MFTNEPKEFIEFASTFPSDYLQNNYKEVVKEFSIKQNTEKKREVKPSIMLNNRPLISYYGLEQYKEMTMVCLSKPLANKEDVIQVLLQKYIINPLKNVESDCSKIYQNIKAGQTNQPFFSSPFLFYSRVIAIEELVKFENFLLNLQNIGKNSKLKKAEKTLLDFIHNVKDKEQFVKDLKSTFNTESGILFKIIIELLKEERIFLIGERSFASFYRVIKPHFNQEIGTQNALNDMYKHKPDEQTLYDKEIRLIQVKLNPLIEKYKG